jgi:hypothetical protein
MAGGRPLLAVMPPPIPPRNETPPPRSDLGDARTAGMLASSSSDESSETDPLEAESSERSAPESSKSDSGLTSRTTVGPFLGGGAVRGTNDTFLLLEDSAGEFA